MKPGRIVSSVIAALIILYVSRSFVLHVIETGKSETSESAAPVGCTGLVMNNICYESSDDLQSCETYCSARHKKCDEKLMGAVFNQCALVAPALAGGILANAECEMSALRGCLFDSEKHFLYFNKVTAAGCGDIPNAQVKQSCGATVMRQVCACAEN